ncbi:hypothetical protein D9M69_573350 [compost metagenome]
MHATATDLFAGYQFQLRLTGWQAVQMVDQLLQFAQIEHLMGAAGEGHGQLAVAGELGTVEALQLALDDDDREPASGEVLLRQIGAGGDVAPVQVVTGDQFEQFVELGDTEAVADEGGQQFIPLALRQKRCALDIDLEDLETMPLLHDLLRGAFEGPAG